MLLGQSQIYELFKFIVYDKNKMCIPERLLLVTKSKY